MSRNNSFQVAATS